MPARRRFSTPDDHEHACKSGCWTGGGKAEGTSRLANGSGDCRSRHALNHSATSGDTCFGNDLSGHRCTGRSNSSPNSCTQRNCWTAYSAYRSTYPAPGDSHHPRHQAIERSRHTRDEVTASAHSPSRIHSEHAPQRSAIGRPSGTILPCSPPAT